MPLNSLLSIETVQKDPIFSDIFSLGHQYDEFQILIIYILYQRSLGDASTIFHYIEMLLSSFSDTMPSLWSYEKLYETYPEPDNGVRIATEAIHEDIKAMYDETIPPLISSYPTIFAPRGSNSEWMYSLQNFGWAYTMVNSRHWHVPCDDLDSTLKTENLKIDQSVHTFLVPMADFINFGPPCTKGHYNQQTHAFEIIATCNFAPNQEITFWYTDDCEDIVLANYGFTHHMISKCPIVDQDNESDRWRDRAHQLNNELSEALNNLQLMRKAINELQSKLEDCGCDADIPLPEVAVSSRNQVNAEEKHEDSRRNKPDVGVRGSGFGVRRIKQEDTFGDVGL